MKRFGALIFILLAFALVSGCASTTVSVVEERPDGTKVTKSGPANFFLAEKQYGALSLMAKLQGQGAFSHRVHYGGNMAPTPVRATRRISAQQSYRVPRGYKLVPDTEQSAYQPRAIQPQHGVEVQPAAVFKNVPASGYKLVAREPAPEPLPPAFQDTMNRMPGLTVTSPNPFVAQYMASMANFSRYREKSNAELWAMLGGKTLDGIVGLGKTFIPWYFGAQIAGDLLDNMGTHVNTGGGDAIVGDGNNWSQWDINSSGDYSPWAIQQGEGANFQYKYKPDNSSESPVVIPPVVVTPPEAP